MLPINTGLTLSPPFTRNLLTAGTELPLCAVPLGALPLEGEHDCRLGRIDCGGSTEDDLELGAPGLPRQAEDGLSGIDVLRFGGASWVKPGISEGFHGLDLTTGELPREGTELWDTVEPDFVTEEDLPGGAALEGILEGVEARLVGVADLDIVFDAVREGLDVGVGDLADAGVENVVDAGTTDLVNATSEDLIEVSVEDLAGVKDLGGGSTGFPGRVDREVGVEALEGFPGKVDREIGVEALEGFPGKVA